jgi:hypothetical protein
MQSILSPKKRSEVWFPCFLNNTTTKISTTKSTTKPKTTLKTTTKSLKPSKKTTTTEPFSTSTDLIETTEITTDG